MVSEAWAARPFARTFDLISSEYGWTDQTILDLTLGRFRQIRDVLFERRAEDRRDRLRDKEVEVRTLAMFSARSPEAQKRAREITLLEPPAGADGTAGGRRVGIISADAIAGLERAR